MSIPADALLSPATSDVAYTIAAVERDTRISKDTLRIWERRYGFPLPSRDSNGERIYTQDQIERLRHVKRLMDAGHRPGRIVALDLTELRRIGDALLASNEPVQGGSQPGAAQGDDTLASELLDILRRHEPRALRRALTQQLLIRGLARFISEVVVPLLGEIGLAWSRGRLEVFE
ncbi:MAG: hypothetical protein RL375_4524, partial [Pseudomonadota bacterium]